MEPTDPNTNEQIGNSANTNHVKMWIYIETKRHKYELHNIAR